MKIRDASLSDTPEILSIYSYYIDNTAITFELSVPSEEEFKQRIVNITEKYPYLVAVENGSIVGFAYAHEYNPREAYSWCVEISIYIDHKYRRDGIGSMLFKALEDKLRRQNVKKLISLIAYKEEEGKYLTKGSIYFHEKEGFQLCGKIQNSGYKFDLWWDLVIMEKDIGIFSSPVEPFVSYKDTKKKIMQQIVIN